MPPRRTKARPITPEEEFRRRWSVNRFPNKNIARDLEPHEIAQKRREAAQLGIKLQ